MSVHIPHFAVTLPLVPWRLNVPHFEHRSYAMLDDQNVDVTYSESDTKGRYGAFVRGFASAAELTVSKVTPELVIADHTYVPDELRGRGLARTLVMHLIAGAHAKGQRIVPLCPFVRAYAQKHEEEVGDVFQW